MRFLSLILTNTRRHRVRTLVGVAGIAFGVAAMICVVTLLEGAVRMFERILSDDSEVIVFERNVSDLFFSSVPLEAATEIAGWENVRQAEPALFGLVSLPERPAIACFGVTPGAARLRTATWRAGSVDKFAEGSGVVLGLRAAELLGVGLGDEAPVGHERFRVDGIVELQNGFEDGGVFMPLELAQRFLHREGVASILSVSLEDSKKRQDFIRRVQDSFPYLIAIETQEFSSTYSQFKILRVTAWAVGGSAFLLGGLSVANTMILSVFSRIREIAILRVQGFSRSQIACLILGESGMVALLGASAGIAMGAVALNVSQHVRTFQGYLDPQLDPAMLGWVVVLALATGLLGAFYPAAYAAGVQPAHALRFE